MKHRIFVSIATMTLAVSTLAQQKSIQHNPTKVGKEFSQAANKAPVAIRMEVRSGDSIPVIENS